VAANLPMYALGLRVVPTARPDDGLLDVRVFQRGTALQVMRYFALLQTAAHEYVADVVHLQARKIRIEADEPVPMQIDGDPAGRTPAEVTVDSAAAQLFVPESFRLASREKFLSSRTACPPGVAVRAWHPPRSGA
ncbi:MAG: diacylglycerol/lipid kinase family protein, partial [Maioricimonas sp. JB049]